MVAGGKGFAGLFQLVTLKNIPGRNINQFSITPYLGQKSEEEKSPDSNVPIDEEIEQLQRDLKVIAAKLEDYHFHKNELDQELGH